MQIGFSVINAIAVEIENANALCPLGIPPFKGVPSPKIAFILIYNLNIVNINKVNNIPNIPPTITSNTV